MRAVVGAGRPKGNMAAARQGTGERQAKKTRQRRRRAKGQGERGD